MSEQGWKQFIGSHDLDDWVVLHGGPVAVFRVTPLEQAAQLALAVAAIPLLNKCDARLTLSNAGLTIRITRDIWELESHHIVIARAISEIARQHGAIAEREATQEVQFAISAKKDEIDVEFWRVVLGYIPASIDNAVDPLGHSSTVWMQELNAAKSLRHAMHIDVSVSREQVRLRLAAAVAAGGRIVDDSHAPSHWTLADRAGNKVCICAWPDGSVDEPNDAPKSPVGRDFES